MRSLAVLLSLVLVSCTYEGGYTESAQESAWRENYWATKPCSSSRWILTTDLLVGDLYEFDGNQGYRSAREVEEALKGPRGEKIEAFAGFFIYRPAERACEDHRSIYYEGDYEANSLENIDFQTFNSEIALRVEAIRKFETKNNHIFTNKNMITWSLSDPPDSHYHVLEFGQDQERYYRYRMMVDLLDELLRCVATTGEVCYTEGIRGGIALYADDFARMEQLGGRERFRLLGSAREDAANNRRLAYSEIRVSFNVFETGGPANSVPEYYWQREIAFNTPCLARILNFWQYMFDERPKHTTLIIFQYPDYDAQIEQVFCAEFGSNASAAAAMLHAEFYAKRRGLDWQFKVVDGVDFSPNS